MTKIFLSLAALMAFCACGKGKTSEAPTNLFPDGYISFPEIPSDILEPTERAAYVLENFWNPLDFANSAYSCDTTFMEQSFVNFAQFYQFVPDSLMQSTTEGLLQRAVENPCSYRLLAYLSDKYLYDRESDLYNETAYIPYLEQFSTSPLFSADEKRAYSIILSDTRKNRPGMLAADFRFMTRDGAITSLHRCSHTPYTLLVFYDPECDTCHELIERIAQEPKASDMVRSGKVAVVAIDAEGDRQAWEASKSELPREWIVGFDLDGILDNDTYVYSYPPSIYLLDAGKKVILKEPSFTQLIDYAGTH